MLITGPQGFERSVLFALDEDPTVITERVRATIDETVRTLKLTRLQSELNGKHARSASDARRQLRREQAVVGSLDRQLAHRCDAHVDRD